MGLSTLTFNGSSQINWTATKSITGSTYNPTGNISAIKKTKSLGTGAANAAAGGANQHYSAITSIAASGSATLDLTSLTNILGDAASFTRVKQIYIRLLSAVDDPTYGTAASSVTIGNNGTNDFISQASSGWLGTAASTFVLPNGALLDFYCPNAAGVLVDATHKIIKITNNDAILAAKVEITIVGGDT